MKTHLQGAWRNKLTSLVEMREKIRQVREVHECISSFQVKNENEREAFLAENEKALVDIYLLIGMVIRDQDKLIKERAKVLNKNA